jgi:hypothetical protein
MGRDHTESPPQKIGIQHALVSPHFYEDFYVYQYATSIAASAFFADAILGSSANARDKYLGVLRAGGSDSSRDSKACRRRHGHAGPLSRASRQNGAHARRNGKAPGHLTALIRM